MEKVPPYDLKHGLDLLISGTKLYEAESLGEYLEEFSGLYHGRNYTITHVLGDYKLELDLSSYFLKNLTFLDEQGNLSLTYAIYTNGYVYNAFRSQTYLDIREWIYPALLENDRRLFEGESLTISDVVLSYNRKNDYHSLLYYKNGSGGKRSRVKNLEEEKSPAIEGEGVPAIGS